METPKTPTPQLAEGELGRKIRPEMPKRTLKEAMEQADRLQKMQEAEDARHSSRGGEKQD